MVFRKPYAFLIKNFKKIHIFLLVLCAYIYYKTLQLDKFVNNFMIYLSYNKELEPISKYTSLLLYIFTILVIITFLALLILLKRKKKPELEQISAEDFTTIKNNVNIKENTTITNNELSDNVLEKEKTTENNDFTGV